MTDAHSKPRSDSACEAIEQIFDALARVDHVEACPACSARLDAAQRHAALLGGLSIPADVQADARAQLRSRAFLESIYERAADESALALGDDVRSELSTRFEVPAAAGDAAIDFERLAERVLAADGVEFGTTSSGRADRGGAYRRVAPFEELEHVAAPAMLWPRIRADLEDWSGQRRRTRRLVRRASLAAAATLLLGLWMGTRWFDQLPIATPDMQAAKTATSDATALDVVTQDAAPPSDIVIVRQRVRGSISSAYSLSDIARQTGVPLPLGQIALAETAGSPQPSLRPESIREGSRGDRR